MYPFGLQHDYGANDPRSQKQGREHNYGLNGTELNKDLGIDLYEMPLRSYDPTIARWTTQDPVIHHGLSPYNAFDNNPVYWSDPSGGNSQFDWTDDEREQAKLTQYRESTGVSYDSSGGYFYSNGEAFVGADGLTNEEAHLRASALHGGEAINIGLLQNYYLGQALESQYGNVPSAKTNLENKGFAFSADGKSINGTVSTLLSEVVIRGKGRSWDDFTANAADVYLAQAGIRAEIEGKSGQFSGGTISQYNATSADRWAEGNFFQRAAYGLVNDFWITAQGTNPFGNGNVVNLRGQDVTHMDRSAEAALTLFSFVPIGSTAKVATTADGFLFKGFTIKSPVNIPVQRFGNMSLNRPDFWGLRIGSNKFLNRTLAAIKPEWNSLTQITTGIIPKGTPIKFGVIGPQGIRYPGGSLQFITKSRSITNQATKIVK